MGFSLEEPAGSSSLFTAFLQTDKAGHLPGLTYFVILFPRP
jgi:hypothetical protein